MPSHSPAPSADGLKQAQGRAETATSSSRSRVRLLPPAVIAAIGAAVCTGVWLNFGHMPGHRNVITAAVAVLFLLLEWFWAMFFAGFSRGVKMGLILAAALPPALFFGFARIEEVDGNMVPRLAWNWIPKADALLDVPSADLPAAIDLSPTDQDFPQFLGPERRPMFPDVRLLRNWRKLAPKELWRQPIGAGWSSFSIVHGHALTMEQRGEQELVTCYDLKTGRLEWSHADQTRFSKVMSGDGPRCTPAVSDGKVYALGATGILNCLDGATGRRLWSHNVLQLTGTDNLDWGLSCSPLVHQGLVIVTAGRRRSDTRHGTLSAFDRNSGELAWHAGEDSASFSSPTFAVLGGVPQILVLYAKHLAGHDPSSGKVLWRFDWKNAQPNVPQPFVLPDESILVTSGYGMGIARIKLDCAPDKSCTASKLWAAPSLKCKFSNVVHRDGFVYGLDEGVLVCVDVENGERRWRKGRYGHGQIMLLGDVILVQAESGKLFLVEATPEEFRELVDIPALNGKSWSNPALSGKYLLIRNAEEAVCYELPLEPESSP